MSKESAFGAARQIRSLYALGHAGGMSDPELVGRFLHRGGTDRDDAFSALVQRHGPMVLGVCRRALPGPHEADDVFQAVFLVLARKAGSLRRVEGLRPWLYGVAVRASREARRRSARRRAREGAAMVDDRAQAMPDSDLGDALSLLDEEIQRLPSRYREPLRLCELEGASRRDAAGRLGVPEGTLSSRLSRARSLLRDRLARRGVSLGAGLFAAIAADRAAAMPSDSLIDTTVRLSLSYAARGAAAGTVPAAVYSLAEGVIGMISAAKLKLVVASGFALVATASLIGGLALAVGPRPVVRAAKPPAVVVVEEPIAGALMLRGVVVDEASKPVAGASVLANAYTITESRGETTADGSFAIPSGGRQVDGTWLLARTADGRRAGVYRYPYELSAADAAAPVRVALKPAREVAARVVDADGQPVADAAIEVVGSFVTFDNAKTDVEGSAHLLVPADAKVLWVVAIKPGRGYDYAEFGPVRDRGEIDGVLAGELPATVALTFEKRRTARIKAVDRDGKPLAGVGFYPWLLKKKGRWSSVNYSTRLTTSQTGVDGIATFDWLPDTGGPEGNSRDLLQFWPLDRGFAYRRVIVKGDQPGVVTTTMVRTVPIRGRVVGVDGSPAPGIRVRAMGSGQGFDNGNGQARTTADGTYEMSVSPEEAYAVYVDDKDWTAATLMDLVIREGQPASGIDFRLTRGCILRGIVTVGTGGKPSRGQSVWLSEVGKEAPKELREPGDGTWRPARRQLNAETDAQGRYSFRLGPGSYTLMGPARTKNEKLTVLDEPELVRDFHMARPDKGSLSGRVVRAGGKGEGVADASVEIVAGVPAGSFPVRIRADAEGRFRVDRTLDHCYVCAKSPDGSLGALVEIGAEDAEVVIEVAPTATARGILLDEAGLAVVNREVDWGRRIDFGDGGSTEAFATPVKTDALGRFTLPSLVIGQEYDISLKRDGTYYAAGVVRPAKAEAIDLGPLRAGSYRRPAPAEPEEESSFRPDAPGAGVEAPAIAAMTLDGQPLRLADSRGKYVLLDFWATWCGPWVDEIPQLKRVHDAFGKDGRFAMLSLSVDEKIGEPKAFQAKWNLPWTQGFVGGSVHGEVPGRYGVRAIPAFVLIGPDGKIVARGMRGAEIMREVEKALGKKP